MDHPTTTQASAQRRALILDYLYKHRQGSRQDIADALPISLPTITQNLNDLEREGLVTRNGYFESTGGRRARTYEFCADARAAIGVSVQSADLTIAAFDLFGTRIMSTRAPLDYHDDDTYYRRAAAAITEFIDALGLTRDAVLGVSFAVQGRVSPDGEQVTFGGILGNTGMTADRFASVLPYPCHLIHDAAAAAAAEIWLAPDMDDTLCLFLNEHVGSAIIASGRVDLGNRLRNGNCEHMTLVPNGERCYCGQKGCVDAYCSTRGLTGGYDETVDEFFAAVRDGERAHVKAFDRYLDDVAQTIRNMRTLLDYDVIIGGDIAGRFTASDVEDLRQRALTLSPFGDDDVRITVRASDDDRSALGAALHYIRRFVEEITGLR
ncbi:NagC family transcriptional regulator [Bifidobacterium lemurum]|uniref:NagC family transcriptional regulator n=1 Tax=Bifidobacterium lemurum TaxID=1603886 RepID=A0A261FW24_9BIFI|nr:ROK family transcriptional regulator [Bifidobacterium lemurum]OZG63380.1 NagC family transcriptional regulator [Bifidobacterium lemurum]QOL34287.1 ROK family protein [Bifidobacterium lemurum]